MHYNVHTCAIACEFILMFVCQSISISISIAISIAIYIYIYIYIDSYIYITAVPWGAPASPEISSRRPVEMQEAFGKARNASRRPLEKLGILVGGLWKC